MATVKININQEGFDRRLEAVKKILHKFALTFTNISPIAYVEHCPFPFNNFIYKVDLETPAVPASFPGQQPCTVPPPREGVSSVVVRMSNALAEGLNNLNRVENDVAAQQLARMALITAGLPSLVPDVYAWAPCRYHEIPDETGFGWAICEFRTGADLDGEFPDLSFGDKKKVIGQVADILTALQRIRLPDGVTKFGALTIDDAGRIVSGQMPLLRGGPWDAYADVWVAKLRLQLEEADKSPLLRGWAEGDLRERINAWIEAGGVPRLLDSADTNLRTLVHGDLTMNNLLFDKTSKRVTTILDFDWAAVTHPSEEFLSGLWDLGGGFDRRTEKFGSMIRTGNFEKAPEDLDKNEVQAFEIAKAWNDAVAGRDTVRPSSIKGMEGVLTLRGLENLLCPFELSNETMLKRFSDEEKSKKRQSVETKLIEWLRIHAQK